MGFYKNLKMRSKLLTAFSVIIFGVVIMGIVGITGITGAGKQHDESSTITKENMRLSSDLLYGFSKLRIEARNLLIQVDDSNKVNDLQRSITTITNSINTIISEYKTVINQNPDYSSLSISEMNSLETDIKQYTDVLTQIITYAKSGDTQQAEDLLENNATKKADLIIGILQNSYSKAISISDTAIKDNSDYRSFVVMLLYLVLAVLIILSLIVSYICAKTISRPLDELNAASLRFAEGDLGISVASNSKDETGQLSRSYGLVVNVFRTLSNDLNDVYTALSVNGDIDARIAADSYKGDFKLIAQRVNGIFDSLTGDTTILLDILKHFANGNFKTSMAKLPGKKAVMNDIVEQLQNNLKSISGDVNSLSKSASEGNLEIKIDATRYNGDWKDISLGLNTLLDSIIGPVKETIGVLTEMSRGNLGVSIEGHYKGEYLKMKNAVNTTLKSLSQYITEISKVLNEMAQENFNMDITGEYLGDFSSIKTSLMLIIDSFNDIMSDINASSEQVTEGAKQVSSSGSMLAQGASQQSESIGTLQAMLDEVNSKTDINAKNAVEASNLSGTAKESAALGTQEMHAMLKSMTEINEASMNIAKIIKVIEDIASQTNLLALNAAVEAARAGEHGKGFGVVADQVRTLAGRSTEAAKNTNVLIKGTVDKVSQGMQLAEKTSKMLDSIVAQISDISEIVNNVAESSDAQAKSITIINDNIEQISFVTQANTAASEEAAAAGEELLSQSQILKERISSFKLRANKNRNVFTVPSPPIATVRRTENRSTSNYTSGGDRTAVQARHMQAKAAQAVTKQEEPAFETFPEKNEVKSSVTIKPVFQAKTAETKYATAMKPAAKTMVKPAVGKGTYVTGTTLKPSLPEKTVKAAEKAPTKTAIKTDSAKPSAQANNTSQFVATGKQMSGAVSVKPAVESVSSKKVYDAKDFGKY